MSLAPFMPLAMSAAWAAIFEAIIPSLTSWTFGRARCSDGVTYHKKPAPDAAARAPPIAAVMWS